MTIDFIPELKITPRAGYLRGQEGFEQILRAAHNLLVNEGAKALTNRRIAEACGLKAGNLAHYFKSKDELIRELLDAIIGGYEDAFEEVVALQNTSPQERFEQLIELILEDITTKKTTRIFPELWVMSNHSSFVEERVDELYRRARVALNDLIAEMNPALGVDERETLALFISASMEGMTIFAGYRKKWQDKMPALKRISKKSFTYLVTSIPSPS